MAVHDPSNPLGPSLFDIFSSLIATGVIGLVWVVIKSKVGP